MDECCQWCICTFYMYIIIIIDRHSHLWKGHHCIEGHISQTYANLLCACVTACGVGHQLRGGDTLAVMNTHVQVQSTNNACISWTYNTRAVTRSTSWGWSVMSWSMAADPLSAMALWKRPAARGEMAWRRWWWRRRRRRVDVNTRQSPPFLFRDIRPKKTPRLSEAFRTGFQYV